MKILVLNQFTGRLSRLISWLNPCRASHRKSIETDSIIPMNDYPWYTVVSNSSELQQGDLIEACPIVIPPPSLTEGGEYSVDVKFADVVVISQSCDLENDKIDLVLVCPYYSLTELAKQFGDSAKTLFNKLSKGQLIAYHLLDKDVTKRVNDYPVVDFSNVYGVNITYLRNHTKEYKTRARLLPPYREHLSQSFARFFMRVGLPSNIKYEE